MLEEEQSMRVAFEVSKAQAWYKVFYSCCLWTQMWNSQLLLQHYVYLHAALRLTVMKMDYISESVSKLHGNAFFYRHVKAFVMVSHHSNKKQ